MTGPRDVFRPTDGECLVGMSYGKQFGLWYNHNLTHYDTLIRDNQRPQQHDVMTREDWLARWPHFWPDELACRGTNKLRISTDLLDILERIRRELGGDTPLAIRSAYRTPLHNKAVQGAKNSMHLHGFAADISTINVDPIRLYNAAKAAGVTGFGFYPKDNFMHLDIGPRAEWGDRRQVMRTNPKRGIETPAKATSVRENVKGQLSVASALSSAPAVLNGVAGLNLPAWLVGSAFVLAVGLGAYAAFRHWRGQR